MVSFPLAVINRPLMRYTVNAMRSKLAIFPLLALAGVFMFSSAAKADDGPTVSRIGSVKPVQESVISMDKELVEFTVPADLARSIPGKATFWFTNPTDKDVTVDSIFPLTFEGPGSFSMATTTYAMNVRAKVNGIPAKGEIKFAEYPYRDSLAEGELEPKKAEGYAFPFKVPAKKTITVEVTFDAPLSDVAYPSFYYYIGSGAGWAGSIREAKFVMHYPYPLKDGWAEIGAWDELNDRPVTGTASLVGKDYALTFRDVEPGSRFGYLSLEFLPPYLAKKLIAAEADMASFETPEEWRELAELYRSFEFENGQFDAHRPRFAVGGYWKAVDKYLAAKKINPSMPADYFQATELAEIYSDHWAPMISEGPPDRSQFYDLKRQAALMDYLESQKDNWWGIERYRMEQLLALDAWWRGKQPTSSVTPVEAKPASTGSGSAQLDQAAFEQIGLLKQEAQVLRDEVKRLQPAGNAPLPGMRSIDPIVALLLVFGGVGLGFVTVALVKRSLAKKSR